MVKRLGTAGRHAPLILANIIFGISAISAGSDGDWANVALLVSLFFASLVPLVVERRFRVMIPVALQLLYAVLLIGGPYWGNYLHFYTVVTPWDMIIHFYSGFVITLASVYFLVVTEQRYDLALPPWFEMVVVLSVHGFVALLWEVAEFTVDATIGTSAQLGNYDTMTDMIVGTMASFIVVVGFILLRRRGWFRWLDLFLPEGNPGLMGLRED